MRDKMTINPLPDTRDGMLQRIEATFSAVRSLSTAFHQSGTHGYMQEYYLAGTGCQTWEDAEAKRSDRLAYLKLLIREYRSNPKFGDDLEFLLSLAVSTTCFQEWQDLLGEFSVLTTEQQALLRLTAQRS